MLQVNYISCFLFLQTGEAAERGRFDLLEELRTGVQAGSLLSAAAGLMVPHLSPAETGRGFTPDQSPSTRCSMKNNMVACWYTSRFSFLR